MDNNWTEATDLELVRGLTVQDESALAELHRRYLALCRRRAFNVLRNHALADEAVQDAFLDLWRNAGGFDPARAAARTWLCVLVHRRSVDIARREARHHLTEARSLAPDPESYTAEELLLTQIDRRRVRAALDQLSPRHQQVIELAYWAGLSQSQIAVRCGVPVGTVKSRTFDALARLAALLGVPETANA